jgi:Myc proto-oncogene protein
MMFETSLYEDGPFLDSQDLGFKTDPSDIFSLTLDIGAGGWESHTPPDSPSQDFTLSSFCDPTLLKPTKFFEEDVILPNLGLPERIEESSLYSTWDTPPASPISDSSGCDDWLGESLPLFGPSTSRTTSTATSTSKLSYKLLNTTTAPTTTSHKRKSYAVQDTTTTTTQSANHRKKLMREKSVQDRAARTAACERAVSELATQHSSKREDDPETRRHTHNILERKRRNDLKNSYQHLREHVPSLEDNERAPTGQILLHAVDYINSLKQEQANIGATLAQLKSQNEMLRRKIAVGSSK